MDKEHDFIKEIYPILSSSRNSTKVAEKLYKAGYGNVAQAVKEFADRLKEQFCTESDYGGGDIKQAIDELLKELYGE